MDDYGLMQGEVLEGEDHTDEPVAAARHLRGLPAALGRRVRMDEEGNEVVEQLVASEAVLEQRAGVVGNQPDSEMDEPPDELPVLVSRSPLPTPLSTPPSPPPPPPPPPQPLTPFAPESASPAPSSTTAAPLTTIPLAPPSYPLSLLPTRFTAMDLLATREDDDADRDEYVRAHAGEVIEGEHRLAVPAPPASSSVMRGVKRRNKRVVFDADGQQVVEATAETAAQVEQTSADVQQQLEQQQEIAGEGSQTDHTVGDKLQDENATGETTEPPPVDVNLDGVDVHPKYYAQRYRLFSRYDAGIRLDAVGWYSVTPEAIAVHIASRIAACMQRPFTVIDAFAGLGGNTIAFALQPLCVRVIAVELDAHRLSLARHNAAVYGVSDKCEWVQGDWLQQQHQLQADVAGGGRQLIERGLRVRGVEGRVAVSLPRNVDVDEVVASGGGSRVEVEYNRCWGKVKTVTAYFGKLVRARHVGAAGCNRSVQQATQPMSASKSPLSFSTLVLDNSDILRVVASFLCFHFELSANPALDKSLLHFANCCRRTHSLIMRDGPWWRHQPRLLIDLKRPLVSSNSWRHLTNHSDSSAVMVAGFGTRQQRIVRRLIGDAWYDLAVAPKLTTMLDGMYPLFTPDFFNSLVQYLPGSTHHRLSGDCGQGCIESSRRSAHLARHCQWLQVCWDAVTVPKCTRWLTQASLCIDMELGVNQKWQTASVFYALERLPGVTQLSLLAGAVGGEDIDCPPAIMSLTDLTDLLPSLVSLHISRLPLYLSTLSSFLVSPALLHLRLEDTSIQHVVGGRYVRHSSG